MATFPYSWIYKRYSIVVFLAGEEEEEDGDSSSNRCFWQEALARKSKRPVVRQRASTKMELGDEELAASVRRYYNESLEPSLGQHDFNFVLTDPRLQDNPIVYASEGFCAMTGYAHHEVIGRNCRFLQGPETDRRTVLEIRDAVREERACQVHILNYRKDGNAFWNLFYMAPVYSRKDGSVVHFVGVQTPLSSAATTLLLASTDLKSVDDAEGRTRRKAGLGCLQRHGDSLLNDDAQGDDHVGGQQRFANENAGDSRQGGAKHSLAKDGDEESSSSSGLYLEETAVTTRLRGGG